MKEIKIRAKDNRVSYELSITTKFTFIVGDSGTGKTTLLRLFKDNKYSVDCPYELVEIVSNKAVAYKTIGESNIATINTIFFVDEDYRFVFEESFQKAMLQSNSLFIIVGRDKFSAIPHGCEELVVFSGTGQNHVATRPYSKSLYPVIDYNKIKTVLTEDSKSGYIFFKKIFENTITSNGNGNIKSFLEQQSNMLVIIDALGCGAHIREILWSLHKNNNNQILLIDSFEAMVMQSTWLNAWEEPDILCKNREAFATNLLQGCLTNYSKSSGGSCVLDNCCKLKRPCSFEKYGNKLQLVAGEIYLGLKSIKTQNTSHSMSTEFDKKVVIEITTASQDKILQLVSQLSPEFRSNHKSIDFDNPLSIQMHCQMLMELDQVK